MPFLTDIEPTRTISGDLYWDLLPQNDLFGFVEHFDGFQIHFPGDNSAVGLAGAVPVRAPVSDASLVADLRRHAFAMSGSPVPPYPLPWAPFITNVERVASATEGTGNLVEWRGSPGAASYVVRRSTYGPKAPWTTVGTISAAATETPFLDKGVGRNPGCGTRSRLSIRAGPPDLPRDRTRSWTTRLTTILTASARPSAIPPASPSTRAARGVTAVTDPAEFPASQVPKSVNWYVPGMKTVETLAYYVAPPPTRFRFLLSVNGQQSGSRC